MKRRKRWLASLLALVLAVGLLPTAALATDEERGTEGRTETTEAADGETGENVYTLSDDTQVTSTSDVTRAQMAEMVYEHESLKTDIDSMAAGGTEPSFSDTSNCTEDQKTAITALYKANILSGTDATTFNPSGTVTRGEFAVVLWRATGSRSNKQPAAVTFENLPDWCAAAVHCFYGAGLISGVSGGDGTVDFAGNQNITVVGVNTFLTAYATNKNTFISNTAAGSITRAEMTVEFYEKFQPELSKLAVTKTWGNGPFNNLFGCTEEQVEAIKFFYEREIISGTSDTTFHPHTPVSNFQIAALLQRCATKEIPDETSETISLFSAVPLAEQTPVEWLKAQGLDASAAESNPNAPALATTLTTWRDGLAPDAPTFTPESGATFTDSQTVTISAGSEDEGAAIYYTLDSTQLTTSSTPYSGGITITDTTTVKAISVRNNLISEIVTATYTKQTQEPEQPVLSISPSATSLNGGGTITLTTNKAVDTVTCSDSGITVTGSSTTWTASLPNASATYTFTVTTGNETATCTVTVTYKSTSSGNTGGSSSRPSNTTTSTERNPDGSTTTTTTNRLTGTVTETTRYPDGSREVVETKKDGTVTTTTTDTDGNETAVAEHPNGSREVSVERADGTSASAVTDADGRIQAEVSLSSRAVSAAQEDGEAVTLPIPNIPISGSSEDASLVEIDLPRSAGAVKVEIPTEDAGPGTVAVIVNEDGTETVVKKSVALDGGLTLTLETGATVKIVDNRKDFDDTYDHWAEDAIAFATAHEMFGGTSADTFSPDTPMTRGMLAVVLHRFEDTPNHTFTGSFEDVAPGSWYADGIHWMADNGIIGGYGNGNFGADDSITREQLAAILYRYAGVMDYGTSGSASLDRFSDVDSVSGYAVEAMGWAVGNGLIGGMGDGTLAPQGNATRAQVATILMRFVENLAK